ncbi:MAG: hypothetical protein RL064_562 [Bacteroidota bacterium]
MNKYFITVLLLSLFSLQSFKIDAPIPTNETSAVRASLLADKLNINSEAVRMAIIGYEKLKQLGKLTNMRYLTIADFSKPSNEKRLYIIDMQNQVMLMQTLVAHGRNSGMLFAKSFSNKTASFQSSLGFYVTGNPYTGKHGTSLELNGVEQGINDKAKERAIVIHGADYVSNSFVKTQGYAGRSLGCPAVPNKEIKAIIQAIKGASCLFVYAPNSSYLKNSALIN